MAACRVFEESAPSLCPWEGEGARGEGRIPLDDTHGNMLAMLARSGSSSFTVGNLQWYDVWGGVRSGSSSEDQGYVANLGHRKDAESGLTYMRARYYEPATGRFVSEDPARDGMNWYAYASNNPIDRIDWSGNTDEEAALYGNWLVAYGFGLFWVGLTVFTMGMQRFHESEAILRAGSMGGVIGAIAMLVAAIAMVASISAMTQGANAAVRGLLVIRAGQMLQYLGEDGFEYALSFIAAATPNLLSGFIGFAEGHIENPY